MMWTYKNQPVETIPSETTLGFIYKITNLKTGKFYIGRKLMITTGKVPLTKKEKLLPENRMRKMKKITRETDWKKYWGSSIELKSDVGLLGEQSFTREILCFCDNKTDMSFYETYFQIKMDCLFNDTYNRHIANTKFFKGKVNKL